MSKADMVWGAYLAARIAYVKAPSPKARSRVQRTYRDVCEAMGMSQAEVDECMATLNQRNDWPALAMEPA